MKKSVLKGMVIIIAFAFSSLVFILPRAFADGGESRKATAQEKKFLETAGETLRSALPDAPAGWARSLDEPAGCEEVAVGFEKRPVMMSVVANYSKNQTDAEGEAMTKAAEEVAAKNKPAMDAIAKKQEELSSKIAEAVKKTDMKEMERLKKESEALAKEAEKLGAEMTADMRSSSGGDLLKPMVASVNAELNPPEVYMADPVELPKIEGCFVLQAKPENPANDDSLRTVVLVGPWTVSKNAEGALEIRSPYIESAAYDKIMCAAVHIDATRDVTAELLKLVDVKKIAALIK